MKSTPNLKDFVSLDTKDLSVGEVHQFLLSSIAPRPIAFVSTMDKKGKVNLSPFSFFNVFGANPPILIFSPARRVRDNTTKHTLENIAELDEAVVNMVDFSMVEQMSLSSTEYDVGVNEFIKSGLTQLPSVKVGPPRVGEAPASFECKVLQVIETGSKGGAGNLVICEVVEMHFRKDVLNESGKIDPLKLDLVARMGANWYSRSNKDNMFEIPKPLRSKGIGVDSLPPSARNSEILSGNNLGRLGNLVAIPNEAQIDNMQAEIISEGILNLEEGSVVNTLHRYVQLLLEKNENEKALILVYLAERYTG